MKKDFFVIIWMRNWTTFAVDKVMAEPTIAKKVEIWYHNTTGQQINRWNKGDIKPSWFDANDLKSGGVRVERYSKNKPSGSKKKGGKNKQDWQMNTISVKLSDIVAEFGSFKLTSIPNPASKTGDRHHILPLHIFSKLREMKSHF